MTTQSLKFWVRCPHCRQTIGVPSRYVLQYLERVIEEGSSRLEMLGEAKTPARKATRAPSALPPTREAAKKRAF